MVNTISISSKTIKSPSQEETLLNDTHCEESVLGLSTCQSGSLACCKQNSLARWRYLFWVDESVVGTVSGNAYTKFRLPMFAYMINGNACT